MIKNKENKNEISIVVIKPPLANNDIKSGEITNRSIRPKEKIHNRHKSRSNSKNQRQKEEIEIKCIRHKKNNKETKKTKNKTTEQRRPRRQDHKKRRKKKVNKKEIKNFKKEM
jgi:hypothetical protein